MESTFYRKTLSFSRQIRESESDSRVAEIEAIISNNEVDSYSTIMGKSSLQNYARDARNGVSFIDSHDYRKVGIGQSYSGRFENLDDGKMQVRAKARITRGLSTPTSSFGNTDDFITAIETGSAKDISIGFYGGYFRCGECDNTFDHFYCDSCGSYPGKLIKNEKTGKVRRATATIEDARLAEFSLVFDGATPGAEIVRKIEKLNKRGLLTDDLKGCISNLYNVRFKDSGALLLPEDKDQTKIYFNSKSRFNKLMDKEKTVEELRELNSELRDELEQEISEKEDLQTRLTEAEQKIEAFEDLDAESEIEKLEEQVRTLESEKEQTSFAAEQGRKAIESLLKKADPAYRDYKPDATDEEVEAKMESLKRSGDYDHIYGMVEDWSGIARSRRRGKKSKEQKEDSLAPVEERVKPVDARSFNF